MAFDLQALRGVFNIIVSRLKAVESKANTTAQNLTTLDQELDQALPKKADLVDGKLKVDQLPGTIGKADMFVSTSDPVAGDGKDGDIWFKIQ